ncbi:MAG: extracellular solute-binding protein [Bacillaceae bacterium]|nr:extracellular solute-binding protein [Bacillaceae bacterium]
MVAFVFALAACNGGDETGDNGGDEANGNDTTQNEDTEQNDNETNDNNEANNSDEKTVIKFAAQNDNTPATQKVIDAFNSSQDKYVVEWVEMTNDSAQMHDQLLNSLSSESSEYDVISMDVVWAGEFAGAGFLEPIDIMMEDAGLNAEDFNQGSMISGNYKGIQYTLPFFPDLGLLYYRSDIVSEEDAQKLISGDYTYGDLAAMAEKYTGQNDTKYGFVYQSKQYEGLTVNVTEFTDQFSNIEEGLQTMYDFTTADWTPENILTFTEGETHTAFENGDAVFARNWPYMYGRIKNPDTGAAVTPEQVGVAPLPNGGAVGGWLLGISKFSENKEGAWEFLSFLAGPEGQKIMSTEGGYLPGYAPLMEDQEVLGSNDMLSFEGFQNALNSTIARPVSPNYSETSDTIQVSTHKYLSSGNGLDEAAQAIEDALAE